MLIKSFKKIIAVGAHFDDVEINCGGMLAKAIENGSQVKVVVVGNGDFKHYSGEQIREHNEALREGKEAIKCLGVNEDDLICLNFPEKNIPYSSSSVEAIEKVFDSFEPDLIITHWTGDTHQDHINVSKSVISAARYYNNILMWEPIFPSGRSVTTPFHPQLYVDISNVYTKKINSLKEHLSQINKFNKQDFNWIESISTLDKHRGYEVRCKYAEAFQPVRLKLI